VISAVLHLSTGVRCPVLGSPVEEGWELLERVQQRAIKMVKWIGLGSFWWYTVTVQVATGTNWDTELSI